MSVPLNWLGHRMLKLQGPDRPWTTFFRIHLDQPATIAAIDGAWRRVATTRPEASVRLAGHGWHPVEPSGIAIASTTRSLDEPMAPGHTPAIKIEVDADPATTITVIANHALVDGIGAWGIVDDLVAALSGGSVTSRVPVTDEHLDRLRTRKPALRAALRQVPPLRLAELGGPATAPTELETIVIDRALLDRRRSDTGASIGAVLLTAVHAALRDVIGNDVGRIAIGTPADLRRWVGDPDGVGNAVVNLTFAPRHPPTLTGAARFLASEASAPRLGETLTWIHRATRPGPPRTANRTGRAVATAMLSNLGPVGVGDHWDAITGVDFAPPAHQTISIGVLGFGDRVRVTVRRRGDVSVLARRLEATLTQ